MRTDVFRLLILCTVLATPAGAQSLFILPGQGDVLHAQPRQIVTLSFRIRNASERVAMLEPELELPRGFTLLGPQLPFELAPGHSSTMLLHVQVPDAAPAGDHAIRLLLRDRRDPGVREEWRGRIVVSPVLDVDLRLLEAPEFAVAGDPWTAVFVLMSRANAVLTLETEAQVEPSSPVRVSPRALTLAPGESARLEVTVETDGGLAALVRSQATLRVRAATGDLFATAVAATDVIPRKAPRAASFQSLPLLVSFNAVTGDREGGAPMRQLEVSGRGALDPAGRHRIDLHLLGPEGSEESSVLGRRDEYQITYSAPGVTLRTGDQPFEISPLLELGRFGRGIELALSRGPWSLLGFGMEDRFSPLRETGAVAGFRPTRNAALSVSYLDKSAELRSRVGAIEAELALPYAVDMQVEFARNLASSAAPGARALRADLHREGRGLRFDGHWIEAEEGFGGYTQNRALGWWQIEAPVNATLRLFGSFRSDQTNATPRPGLTHTAEDETRAGADFRLDRTTSLTVSAQERRRQELRPVESRDEHRTTALVTASKTIGRASLSAHVEQGRHEDRFTGRHGAASLYRLAASVRPARNQTIYVTASHEDSYFHLGEWERAYGIGSSIELGPAMRLSAEVQLERDERGGREFLQLQVEKELAWGHAVALRGRHLSGESRPAAWLQYAVPVQAPFRRRRDVATVEGRVYEQGTGRGVANVLLRAGRALAVTDERGRYRLAAIAPGDHRLEMDLRSLGASRVAARTVPVPLSLAGGERLGVDIPVAEGARLFGRVVLYRREEGAEEALVRTALNAAPPAENEALATKPSPPLVPSNGIPSIVLVMTRSEETTRRSTDEQGRFSFSGMRPGTWELRVEESGLPPLHRLETEVMTLELRAGYEAAVEIRVLPIQRQLHMQALPELLIGSKEGDA